MFKPQSVPPWPVRDIAGGRDVIVRIKVGDHKKYPDGLARALNGARGQVIKINDQSIYGDPCLSRAYLVKFNRPIRAWWSDWTWVRQWWFAPKDLRKCKGSR